MDKEDRIDHNLKKLQEHRDYLFYKYTVYPRAGDIQVKDDASGQMLFMRTIGYEEAESRVLADELIVVVNPDSELGKLCTNKQKEQG
jgi:hypothetical protein